MGPSELVISGILATAVVAPVSLAIEGRPEVDLKRYVMQSDCQVAESVITSCIVDQGTGKQLGL